MKPISKLLITGNMGYVGPLVVARLRNRYPHAELIGLDTGYFGSCLTTHGALPERLLDTQHFMDVRDVSAAVLEGVDAVVHLAGLSNDPIGRSYEELTHEINSTMTARIAEMARDAGARSFGFASSCSVYGAGGREAMTESSPVEPLTAYAKSKVDSEEALLRLADSSFTVTCLRFATACGMSDRLRLDLVLNDFVASALSTKRIDILSDGTPWRPLINVKDMARALDWAVSRHPDNGGEGLVVNVGSNKWNFRIAELGEVVTSLIPGTSLSINEDATPDKRSYRVSFDLFERLAPDYQPQSTLESTVSELSSGLRAIDFHDPTFRHSSFIRLNVLAQLRKAGALNSELRWIERSAAQKESSTALVA